MICDAADGDDHVSGQQEVFCHFLPQSNVAEGLHVAEHHLPLSPVEATELIDWDKDNRLDTIHLENILRYTHTIIKKKAQGTKQLPVLRGFKKYMVVSLLWKMWLIQLV